MVETRVSFQMTAVEETGYTLPPDVWCLDAEVVTGLKVVRDKRPTV
jgi:hypothetical protein